MMARIIAEVAQGYEGKAEFCDTYVRAAAKVGADAVKFQIVYADDLSQPGHEYYDLYRSLELDVGVWQATRDLAEESGIDFIADIFGSRSLEVVRQIHPHGIKLHASDFFNRPLLHEALALADRVFVSLGGIEAAEVDALVNEVARRDNMDRLVLLTGFQAEPTPIELSHLMRLTSLRRRYEGVQVGYLDHASGESEDQIHLSLMAMTLGADWIEKHITLSRYLEFEDYVSALEPDEFGRYVATLHRMASAMGDGSMTLSGEEMLYRDKSVKKVLVASDLEAGHTMAEDDIVLARTARLAAFEGIHDPADAIGRRLLSARRALDPIRLKDLD